MSRYDADPELKAAIIRELPKYKNLSDRETAIAILKEFPNFTTGKDDLRLKIGRVRKELNAPQEFSMEETETDFALPASLYQDYDPYIIPPAHAKILYLTDIHFPFQDNNALRLALKYGKDRNVNAILLGGDIVDFYGLSKFNKDPNFIDINQEIKAVCTFFEALRKVFGKIPIYYKVGNHEERLEHRIQNAAPELNNVNNIKLSSMLLFNLYDITEIGEKRVIQIGKLNVIHGHELFGAGGQINVARNIRLKTFTNTLFGHFHKTQTDFQRKLVDGVVGGWAVGCLCGLSPLYMPINQWNSGFAVIEQELSGNFEVHNKMIVNGEVR